MNKQQKIEELESTLNILKEEKRKKEREEKEKAEEKIKKETKVTVYHSDDYAGLECGEYSFYFGYEETMCPKHGKNANCEDDHNCEKNEWAFTATKNGKELMRIPSSKLINEWRDVYEALLYGIGQFMNKNK